MVNCTSSAPIQAHPFPQLCKAVGDARFRGFLIENKLLQYYMNKIPKRSWVALSLAAISPWALLCAQSSDETKEEEVFTLSPFQVDGSADQGYLATATTAGSRLNTQLKDVAASVTPLTNAFLDDLGALDVSEGLAQLAGVETFETSDQTEANALNQGFVGGDFNDRNTLEGVVRVRGLGTATNAVNFLATRGSNDRYNIERSEFLRGPNSILFGLGSPAGLVNATTKKAITAKDSGEVQIVLDNFGSVRGSFDINRVLVEDKLALRLVSMAEDEKFMFENSFGEDRRFYGTLTAKPTQNTTVYLSTERTSENAAKPNYRFVQDNVSDWLRRWNAAIDRGESQDYFLENFYVDPAGTFLPNAGDPYGITGSIDPSLSNFGGSNPLPRDETVEVTIPIDGIPLTGVAPANIRRELDGLDRTLLLIFGTNGSFDAPLDGLLTRAAPAELGTGTADGSPASFFSRSGADTENLLAGGLVGFTDPRATDEGIFPWRDIDLSSLPGNFRKIDLQRDYANIEQRVNDDLYLSLAFQRERFTQEQLFSPIAQTQSINLDISQTLPDGRLNPNFLRPFIYGRTIGSYVSENREDLLFQANYDLDFREKTDSLGWLGMHRVTGFYSDTQRDSLSNRWNIAAVNQDHTAFSKETTAAIDDANRQVVNLWYVGSAVQPGETSLNFTGFPTNVIPHLNNEYTHVYYDRQSGGAAADRWVGIDRSGNIDTLADPLDTDPVRFEERTFTNSLERSVFTNKGYGLALQSFLLDGDLVVLSGVRKDEVRNERFTISSDIDPFDQARREIANDRNSYVFDGTARNLNEDSKTLLTVGAVYHATDWARVFYNNSENFDLTTARVDPLTRFVDPQEGETTEYGLGLRLLDDKLDVTLRYYETQQRNETGPNAAVRRQIRGWEDELRGAIARSTSPFNLAEDWGLLRVNDDGTVFTDFSTSDRYTVPNDVVATQDRVAEGYELSVNYNPSRSFRMNFNVSRNESVVSNVLGEVLEYFELRQEFYSRFFNAGMIGNSGSVPLRGTLIPLTAEQELLPDAEKQAIFAQNPNWSGNRFLARVGNSVLSDLAAEGTATQGASEWTLKWTGNYSFREGPLKGLSFGADLRWEDGKFIGNTYKTISRESFAGLLDFATIIADDTNRLQGDDLLTGGLKVGYRTKILNNKVTWNIQLNVRNLIGEGDTRVISMNPDGSEILGINNPTLYRLSNTFKF